MPLSEPPDDPVLAELLSSGGFEHCIRVGCSAGTGAALLALLFARFRGISPAGASWLADATQQAISAGRAIMLAGPDERIDPALVPSIPSLGIPGAGPGDIAVVAKQSVKPEGPGDIAQHTDVSILTIMVPTPSELSGMIQEAADAIQKQYDKGDITEDRADRISEMIFGVYRVTI